MWRAFFPVFLSLIVAWILTILPLPPYLQSFRPEWLSLTLLFWILSPTPYIGVVGAWCAGLGMDILGGAIIGQNALAMTVLAFLGSMFKIRNSRQTSLWQTTFIIFLLILASQVVLLIEQWLIGNPPRNMLYWVSTLTTLLVWPFVFGGLKYFNRRMLQT